MSESPAPRKVEPTRKLVVVAPVTKRLPILAPVAEKLVVDAVKSDEDAAIKLVVDAVVMFARIADRSDVVALVIDALGEVSVLMKPLVKERPVPERLVVDALLIVEVDV